MPVRFHDQFVSQCDVAALVFFYGLLWGREVKGVLDILSSEVSDSDKAAKHRDCFTKIHLEVALFALQRSKTVNSLWNITMMLGNKLKWRCCRSFLNKSGQKMVSIQVLLWHRSSRCLHLGSQTW